MSRGRMRSVLSWAPAIWGIRRMSFVFEATNSPRRNGVCGSHGKKHRHLHTPFRWEHELIRYLQKGRQIILIRPAVSLQRWRSSSRGLPSHAGLGKLSFPNEFS